MAKWDKEHGVTIVGFVPTGATNRIRGKDQPAVKWVESARPDHHPRSIVAVPSEETHEAVKRALSLRALRSEAIDAMAAAETHKAIEQATGGCQAVSVTVRLSDGSRLVGAVSCANGESESAFDLLTDDGTVHTIAATSVSSVTVQAGWIVKPERSPWSLDLVGIADQAMARALRMFPPIESAAAAEPIESAAAEPMRPSWVTRDLRITGDDLKTDGTPRKGRRSRSQIVAETVVKPKARVRSSL